LQEADDRLDKKICPWDAIKMYEFDQGAELSKNFYEPDRIDTVNGVYVMDADEKQRLEKKQIELYLGGDKRRFSTAGRKTLRRARREL
jgi:hypothetical protein